MKFDFMKNILKNNKEYEDFINDVSIKFQKYKDALYGYYKNNDELFPLDGYSFTDDLILVMYLDEYGYSHDTILSVLDYLLLNIANNVEKVFILNFLCGFGTIERSEMDIRNPFADFINK